MPELYILGTSGQAREIAQLARRIDPDGQRWSALHYVAEAGQPTGTRLSHASILVDDTGFGELTPVGDASIGVGRPAIRRRIAQRLLASHPQLGHPNLVSPDVYLDLAHVQLGMGNTVSHGVVLTTDIRIGDFNLLNFQCTVGHDAVIGSWCVINPSANVSGGCRIGDACLIGAGAQVLEGRSVCDGAVVGAGAVVTRDITEPGVYVGIPARRVAG